MSHQESQIISREGHLPDVTLQEYVLGLLDADADKACEQGLRHDRVARNQAAGWSLLFGGALIDEVQQHEPPSWLWTRIDRQIEKKCAEREPASLRQWRIAAAFLLMVGLGVLVGLTVPRPVPFVAQEQAALTLSAKAAPVWQVQADLAQHRLRIIALQNSSATSGKTPVLWLAAANGKTVAVGRLPQRAGEQLTVSPAWFQGSLKSAKLAVSLEPAQTPIGDKPKGPVVAVVGWQPV